jgi:hypothetical protein
MVCGRRCAGPQELDRRLPAEQPRDGQHGRVDRGRRARSRSRPIDIGFAGLGRAAFVLCRISAGVHLPDSTVTTAEGAKFFSAGSAFRAGIAGLELARADGPTDRGRRAR